MTNLCLQKFPEMDLAQHKDRISTHLALSLPEVGIVYLINFSFV